MRVRWVPVDYASHSGGVGVVEGEVLRVLEGLSPVSGGGVVFVSSVVGQVVDMGVLDGGYWFANLRERVRFQEAVEVALGLGCGVFVEVGGHPVLGVGVSETAEVLGVDVVVLGSLRRGEGGWGRFVRSVAEGWVRGVEVDWSGVFPGARLVDLPTYAFQHERYWLPPGAGTADIATVGLERAAHPLLGAAVTLADGDGALLTGRISLRTQPWLADHAVAGSVLLPGTAFVELAVRAGDQLGLDEVEELTLQAPLILTEQDTVTLQVRVGTPDDTGRCTLSMHSRRGEESWTLHATGTLGRATPVSPTEAGEWLPPDAEELDVTTVYQELARYGYGYGPAFQGLQAAWRRDGEIFAEIELPDDQQALAERFAIHPALLDAALHPMFFAGSNEAGVHLPFAWSGVVVYATGATKVRVRLTPSGGDQLTLTITDESGQPVAAVRSLVLRPTPTGQLGGDQRATEAHDRLFGVDWVPVPPAEQPVRFAVVGADPFGLSATVPESDRFTEVAAIAENAPEIVVAGLPPVPGQDPAAAAHEATERALRLVQAWLAAERPAGTRLVLVTRGAVAVHASEDIRDLGNAAASGLITSAQSENPGRFLHVDIDDDAESLAVFPAVLTLDEQRVAIRSGAVTAPRLVRVSADDALIPPSEPGPWRLESTGGGTLENVAMVPCPDVLEPLGPGQVRLAVHAVGMNFRDVIVSLGMVAGQEGLGGEAAGVVLAVGDGVENVAVGDRVLGLCPRSFGPIAITDHRFLAPMPEGWSYQQAASIPITYLTAYYGLFDLGGLAAGQSVLVHAAAGGVGMAAVQLARHAGAEVYGTASVGKWQTLRDRHGLDEAHLGNSRTLEFEQHFLASTGGRGMDVVLDCLAGEFVDAGLRLLPRGGHFLEMGKTDKRDPDEVAADYPGVSYRAYDILDAGPDRLQEILRTVIDLFGQGVLELPPITTWDIRRAKHALRALSQARLVGKAVLTIPQPLDPAGTVLITGGTGTLGALLARHLVTKHGVRHLLLTSRRGPHTPQAHHLHTELTTLGAHVTITACDTTDRTALHTLLTNHHPTTVIHTAGILDDAPTTTLTTTQLHRVLQPKIDAATHLHELTKHHPLTTFILYSSASGLLGAAGQPNYAAANAYLDALAHHRRANGLPATSIAWGFWAERSAMTGHLEDADVQRMRRAGFEPIDNETGMALFDLATVVDRPLTVPVALNLAAVQSQASAVPPLLRGLVQGPGRRVIRASADTDQGSALRARLSRVPAAEGLRVLTELVCTNAAVVLGHTSAEAVTSTRPFKEVGFDSLTAIELRNRLNAATGLRLSATLIFDHPTPDALAAHLRAELVPAELSGVELALRALDSATGVLATIGPDDAERDRVTNRLQTLLASWVGTPSDVTGEDDLDSASDDDLFDLVDKGFGLV
ncbi:SDR family NAD(P)-dependent oxidoreductase [Micromonospora sp. FIMYZ51]|uniref:SDR family NAD(P)-dependent oxidoreductase n=1 Tax=Micromonospora sp. FIMYZ51 TaxID=3051832 RepID=UPI00311D7DDA